MKDKIGILTFQDSSNYGAILQAYALNKTINQLGGNCETINYHCDAILRANSASVNNVKELIKNIYKNKKTRICHKFVDKYMKLSTDYKSGKFTGADYKACIVGSDQVWNPKCTGNDDNFFFKYLDKDCAKYSYAASIGLNGKDALDILEKYKSYIQTFTTVSLREHIDDEQVDNILKKNVRYDIDPVFLLSANEWIKICSKAHSNHYIFIYTIGRPNDLYEFAKQLQKKTGLKIIDSKRSLEFIMHCSPQDFLSWIYNADYVVTNSFHGTAFSIIFNKMFFSECEGKDGINYRVNELLNLTGLKSHDIKLTKLDVIEKQVDYTLSNEIIDNEVSSARSYLSSIINT